ncbi:MAG TPA: hypothetical protein VE821_16060, partial [Pyrinomonadaceae bacterium]|nr:hypothetical protein [Pyrinomonadaceae bacterium]
QANNTNAARANDEKAEQIVARALAAVGGNAYLAVRTTIGRGIITPFAKGVSQNPSSFVDYTVLPDRERTEFRGGGNHVVQVNTGSTGWLFDAAARTLKDQPPADIENFQLSLRTSLDSLLRGWWRRAGATLTYVGRREAGLAKRNETVRLTYPDGFVIDYEIGAKDNLPAKALFKRKTAEGADVQEEDRYARYLTVAGITLPYVIDHYRGGEQTSRISYDSIEFNANISDALFAKPANIKAIK